MEKEFSPTGYKSIIRIHINYGETKKQIRLMDVMNGLSEKEFEDYYNEVMKEKQVHIKKERQEAIKNYGKVVSFRLPEKLYKKYQRWVYQEVGVNPKNASINYIDIFEEGLKVKLKKVNLDWDEAE